MTTTNPTPQGKYCICFHFQRAHYGGGMVSDTHTTTKFPDDRPIESDQDVMDACAAWKTHTPSAYNFQVSSCLCNDRLSIPAWSQSVDI